MRESNGFYFCDFLVTDLPLNAPIEVGVDLVDHRSLPFEAWKGGSAAQPPPGQQRTIIIVGGREAGVSAVDTGRAQRSGQDQNRDTDRSLPNATQIFEMV
jgi:hypothetical protein